MTSSTANKQSEAVQINPEAAELQLDRQADRQAAQAIINQIFHSMQFLVGREFNTTDVIWGQRRLSWSISLELRTMEVALRDCHPC